MKPLFPLFFVLFIAACSEDNDEPLTFDHFQNDLKAGMTYTQLVRTFGEPFDDIGSGIHIYVYDLADSTQMYIGFTDKILYARHLSADGKTVLHELI